MVINLGSFMLSGMGCDPIEVELCLSNQLPCFTLVGLASSLTQESRERVRAAVTHSGFEWPNKKVTVNLLPTDVPKWGTHFELPMAIAVVASQMTSAPGFRGVYAVGELSLSGTVRSTGIAAAMVAYLEKIKSHTTVICSTGDARVLGLYGMKHVDIKVVGHLSEIKDVLATLAKQDRPSAGAQSEGMTGPGKLAEKRQDDISFELLKKVEDEPLAVLSALVAIANDSVHLMLAGPHGSGKSMTAQAVAQARGVITLKSLAERGLLDRLLGAQWAESDRHKPLVRLQSTMTKAAMEGAVGPSGQIIPGELSRAHGGMVIMDEFLEFRRDALECMRQPLEEGVVRLQRARHRIILPARFQLVATTNLCGCGLWSPGSNCGCRCSHGAFYKYIKKLSGPLMDRFGLFVILGGYGEDLVAGFSTGAARCLQRLLQSSSWPSMIEKGKAINSAPIDSKGGLAPKGQVLTQRGRSLVNQVAQTIAALDGQMVPRDEHLELALALRADINKSIKSNIYPNISIS